MVEDEGVGVVVPVVHLFTHGCQGMTAELSTAVICE
jgi:hypothetical protein